MTDADLMRRTIAGDDCAWSELMSCHDNMERQWLQPVVRGPTEFQEFEKVAGTQNGMEQQ